MNKRLVSSFVIALMCAALIPSIASAQLAAGITAQQLWVDPSTGQVFIRPGRNRVPLRITGAPNSADIDQQVERKVNEKMQVAETRMQAQQAQLVSSNQQLQSQVTKMNTGWQSYMRNWGSKIKIGTLLYGDYALYTHTGFGPQYLTQIYPPGPGNNMYNSFDITRTYLNVIFSPTDDWTFRLTPNMYRQVGNTSNVKQGTNSAFASDLNGDLGVRIKYAYLRYNSPLKFWAPTGSDTFTIGQQSNPLVDWQEQMFGYRFVTLTPWNFLSLSSTQVGMSMQGPIVFNEMQYLDYDFGVYNNANFHSYENTNTKQAMARISAYPFGAKWRFDGLGITGFFDYGWGNTTPDAAQLPTPSKNGQSAIMRTAAILHYTTEQFNLAAEFDYGKNAYNTSNAFSASGPPQVFGLTGPPQYAAFSTMAIDMLNNGQSTQEGFNMYGHYHIPNTPFSIFGLYEWFQPNTKINEGPNPLDFERFVVGVGYQYNEYLRFALDSQNTIYYHSQFTSHQFGLTVPDAVPRDTHAVFLNVEFNY